MILATAADLAVVVENEDFIDALAPVPRAVYETIDCAVEHEWGSAPDLDPEMVRSSLNDALYRPTP